MDSELNFQEAKHHPQACIIDFSLSVISPSGFWQFYDLLYDAVKSNIKRSGIFLQNNNNNNKNPNLLCPSQPVWSNHFWGDIEELYENERILKFLWTADNPKQTLSLNLRIMNSFFLCNLLHRAVLCTGEWLTITLFSTHQMSMMLKNWCFWTVVLEKTPETHLDCKKI